jgi:protein-disulfide isomerase
MLLYLHMKHLNQKGETSLIQTVMVAALIVAAFFIGMLWTKVQSYEKGGKPAVANNAPLGAGDPVAPTKVEVDPVSESDHVRGNRNARVALIEYSDLECPFCKVFHPTAKQALSAYGDQLMWVFRHFPLEQLHAKAKAEAAASECATILGGEDKFWAYIDRVYELTQGNDSLDAAQLPAIAGELGLDVNKFKECQTSGAGMEKVSNDYASGIKAGINGTPGNILLDTKTGATYEIPGAVPYDQLKQMIDNFIATLE